MSSAITAVAVGQVVGGAIARGNDDNGAGARASEASARAANMTAEISKEKWESYKTNYQPLEKNLISLADASGSDAEITRKGGMASATAMQSLSGANAIKRRNLTRIGVNPNSGNYAALANANEINAAKVNAGAVNLARTNELDSSFAKKKDVVATGLGISSEATAGLANASNSLANLGAQGAANNRANAQAAGAFGAGLIDAGIKAFK